MIPTDSAEMSESDGGLVWRSGDWVDPPNKQPPYNGIQITAIPQYDPETNALTALGLKIQDFAKSKTGAELKEEFDQITDGAKITLPKPKDDFTVAGALELRFSQVAAGDVVLFVNLHYGLPHERHHADGGILEVPLTDAGGEDLDGGDGADRRAATGLRGRKAPDSKKTRKPEK